MGAPPQPDAGSAPPTCLALIEAVAAREGVPPTELEPQLYEAVDPDALETLLSIAATAESSVTVGFEYAGYDVVVGSDGTLVVE
jgi:hypothetical protein